MQESDVQKIRSDMASGYLRILEKKQQDGEVSVALKLSEIWELHNETFGANGLPRDAWTLDPVLRTMEAKSRDAYWGIVLSGAGDAAEELMLAIKTDRHMSLAAAIAPPEERALAQAWLLRFDSPSGIASTIGAATKVVIKQVTQAISETFGLTPDPVPNSPVEIQITPSEESRRQIRGEDEAREDVSNGFVEKRLTHGIAFNDGTLSKTDFTSAQMGGLATGGLRPGELQRDPNVRPNEYLSQFYRDTPNPEQPDYSLHNAVVGNGLSALTTTNVYVDPLLLDLSGQGAGLTAIEDGVLFDVDNSGSVRRTGWADRVTGMLVHDEGTGGIRNISQLFSEYYGGKAGLHGSPGETPFKDGFAALASVDANSDGAITPDDPIWSALKVWVDANHDGRSDEAELQPLQTHGITAVSFGKVQPVNETRQGNQLLARGSFIINGVEREVLAVKFLADTVSNQIQPQETGTRLTSSSGLISRTAFVSHKLEGDNLDAGVLGVDNVYGSIGNDVLTAAATGSWLVGGAGSNTYVGGSGNDVFVISASDDQGNIRGNGGRDTVLIVGDQGVGLNLAEAGVTIAQGGRGPAILASGGQRGVFIKGGSGDSLLIGGGGNDVLVGGSGRNNIIGGSGKAVIYAGPNGDTIQASDGGSIIYAGGGPDQIKGGPADDVIEAGRGNAVIDGGNGLNVLTVHGTHDEYVITRTDAGYQVADSVAERDGTLSLTNIQRLSFSDISAVNLTGANAIPVADTLAPDQLLKPDDASSIIPAAVLLANDQLLNATGPLRIAAVSDARGAIVTLTEQGDVRILAEPGHTGNLSFRYEVVDALGNPSLTVVDTATGETAPMRATVNLRTNQAISDPLVSRQWYLNEINVLPVWEDYTGKGIRIGQFEPGGQFAVSPEVFDINHPDLKSNVDSVWLETQRANGTLPTEISNHATQVAGVMVAARNSEGGIGIAHEATLGGHYLANSGEDLGSLGQMVNYDIANNSWSFRTDFALTSLQNGQITTSTALAANARYAAGNGRGGLGTVIVAAGGNTRIKGGSAQGSLTNNNRFTIEVGAINAKSDLSILQVASAPFSNPGASLLVSAPGSNVLSSSHALETERGSIAGHAYSSTQGTSFAAPIVSGVVALMLQANPNLGYRDVQQILSLSARKVEDPASEWRTNGARNWNGGGLHASHDYGLGAVDARAAVRLAESWAHHATAADEKILSVGSGKLARQLVAGEVITAGLSMDAGVRIEHIEIDLDATVGRLGDLTVSLLSPAGTRSILLDRSGKAPAGENDDVGSLRSGEFKYRFMSTHHWGETSEGIWTLEVSNAVGGLPLSLNEWEMHASGSAATSDDTYFVTDEYALAVQLQPERAMLDDSVNGTAGGRNTLNAAAVSGDVSIDLGTGVASIAGSPLTLGAAAVQNLVTGDGNDTLIAGKDDALLDGGRGRNRLVGGSGRDRYVVHRRMTGTDVVEGFELDREVIDLVGFGGQQFNKLQIVQQDSSVNISLGPDQLLVLANRSVNELESRHFEFKDTNSVPVNYVDSSVVEAPLEPFQGRILLSGGAGGVSYSTDAQGNFVASLTGTVYSRTDAAPAMFVVVKQDGVDNYANALRGFRHGVDKIDLSQTGISNFDDLAISKKNRATLNNISQIHGVSVSSHKLREDGSIVELLYLDALETAQLGREDFIFAQPALATVEASVSDIPITAMQMVVDSPILIDRSSTAQSDAPNLANLIDSMAAFAPASLSSSHFNEVQPQSWHSMIAVSA
ncbi:hypothetical protein PS627_00846 [Pseudomonas fluorescens]|uniref:S8 family serine peptidase n=1 Tax=Pseudomonas fluorescens TaxID=294 RepID=UPI0012516B0C|nr:S8 family serine peptidase [Pseudomonas fluorescens]CAG8864070.1 hypothetical protein PS627_00846 [Pseudomonas fluorescens]VVP94299.1 hypothetical protein PS910_03178 [Pseudomonas fluorescens]